MLLGVGSVVLGGLGPALGRRPGFGASVGSRAAGAGPGSTTGSRSRWGLALAGGAGLRTGSRVGTRPGAAVVTATGAAPAPGTTASAPTGAGRTTPAPATVASVPPWGSTAASAPEVRVWWTAIARHLDSQFPPVKQGPVHRVHCVFSVAVIVEPHESEPAALLGVPIAGDVNVSHPAVLLENSS